MVAAPRLAVKENRRIGAAFRLRGELDQSPDNLNGYRIWQLGEFSMMRRAASIL